MFAFKLIVLLFVIVVQTIRLLINSK